MSFSYGGFDSVRENRKRNYFMKEKIKYNMRHKHNANTYLFRSSCSANVLNTNGTVTLLFSVKFEQTFEMLVTENYWEVLPTVNKKTPKQNPSLLANFLKMSRRKISSANHFQQISC
jgi:hypothetical protein